MASHHQILAEVPVTTYGKGTSGTSTIRAMFPASPINSGELTDEGIRELGRELLQSAVVNDGGHTFGKFNRDYSDAPEVTKFVPDPGSPGPGSTNPADIPPAPENWPPPPSGAGSVQTPAATSVKIASQTIGSLISGKSYTG